MVVDFKRAYAQLFCLPSLNKASLPTELQCLLVPAEVLRDTRQTPAQRWHAGILVTVLCFHLESTLKRLELADENPNK